MIAMHTTTPTTQPATTTVTLDEESSLPVCALSLTLEEVITVDITNVLVVDMFEFDPVYVVVDLISVTIVNITDITVVGITGVIEVDITGVMVVDITDVTLSLPSPVIKLKF